MNKIILNGYYKQWIGNYDNQIENKSLINKLKQARMLVIQKTKYMEVYNGIPNQHQP